MSNKVRIKADLYTTVDICVAVPDGVTAEELKELYEYGQYTLDQLSEIIMELRDPLNLRNLEMTEDTESEPDTTEQDNRYLAQAIFIDKQRRKDEEV